MLILTWLRTNIIPALIVLGLLAAAAVFGVHEWRSAQTARTRAELSDRQGAAAIQSGADAVQTLGNRQAQETDIRQTAQEGINAINQAPAGHRDDAADRAACRMRSYRHSVKCVALLGPVAE